MRAIAESSRAKHLGTTPPTLQIVTFEVGGTSLALDIDCIQEINRSIQVTRVPHAPPEVLGVTNLRGEVITILDLHIVLGLGPSKKTASSRNLIVKHDDELFGLGVDKVSDIMKISSELSPPPANLQGFSRKLLRGVHQAEDRLIMILDLNELLHLPN
jgi:purine-binding chemotaxis protein CheW